MGAERVLVVPAVAGGAARLQLARRGPRGDRVALFGGVLALIAHAARRVTFFLDSAAAPPPNVGVVGWLPREEVTLLLGAFAALGFLTLGVLELLWPTGARRAVHHLTVVRADRRP